MDAITPGMETVEAGAGADQLPCPRCDGWMAVGGDGRWHCPSCGLASDAEAPAEPGEPSALPPLAEPPTPTRRPRLPGPNPLRRFGACLLLGVVTLGLYFLYYQFKVFREVDRDTGRRHHAMLFIVPVAVGAVARLLAFVWSRPGAQPPALPLAPPALVGLAIGLGGLGLAAQALYFFLELGHLRAARAAVGLELRPSRWVLPIFHVLSALPFVAPGDPPLALALASAAVELLVYLVLNDRVNEYWLSRRAAAAPAP